jgi:hypothetical protein
VTGVVRGVLLALGSAALTFAAEPLHAQACTTPEHHQFDFVLGNWLVRDSSGHAIGTITVSKEYGGCVLIEQWHSVANASEGLGVVGYQPARGRWHREYLDGRTSLLAFDGHGDGATMVMTGTDYPPDGPRLHRVTWTRQTDGAVEERWLTSTDAGRSWQALFYGILRRIAE